MNLLPIWRNAKRLASAIQQAVCVFPRYHQYALGTVWRRQAMPVCGQILRAEQARCLGQLVMAIDHPKPSVPLANELDAFRNLLEFQTGAELAVADRQAKWRMATAAGRWVGSQVDWR